MVRSTVIAPLLLTACCGAASHSKPVRDKTVTQSHYESKPLPSDNQVDDSFSEAKPLPPAEDSALLHFWIEEEPPDDMGYRVRIGLKNISKEDYLWVNISLALRRPTYPKVFGTVVLEISGVDGSKVEYLCKPPRVSMLEDKRDSYLVLSPGAALSIVRDIRCYDLLSHDRVRIIARYQDTEPSPPPPPPLSRWFRGELSSAPIEIAVDQNVVKRLHQPQPPYQQP